MIIIKHVNATIIFITLKIGLFVGELDENVTSSSSEDGGQTSEKRLVEFPDSFKIK
jgi:hypothetical protein